MSTFRKPCIVRSSEPLRKGMTLYGLCHKKIEDARFVLQVEGNIQGSVKIFQDDESLCRKCREVMAVEVDPESRYLYGCIEARFAGKQAEE